MGLGKTRQAIVAAREAAPKGPFLVICPAAVKLNWRREIDLVEPDADVQVVHGKDAFDPGDRWTVVNYDLLGRCEDRFARVEWGGVIVDEAHYIKNDSRRAAHVLGLLGVAGEGGSRRPSTCSPARRWPTGRATCSTCCKAVRHPLGAASTATPSATARPSTTATASTRSGASNVDELATIVSGVMLRRTKSEALDLPPKMRTWVPVEVDGKRVRQQEARALDFFEAQPGAAGRRG